MREFGMFTHAGNKRINDLFTKLDEETIGANSTSDILKSAEKLVKKYRKMGTYKSYLEADDTAVREMVWCVLEQKVGQRIASLAWGD